MIIKTKSVLQIPIPIENQIVQNSTHLVNFTYYGLTDVSQAFSENLHAHYGQVIYLRSVESAYVFKFSKSSIFINRITRLVEPKLILQLYLVSYFPELQVRNIFS